MDRITSMTIFARVAELGSFALAADEFDISATMVGKHIRALETRLGTRLIQRTTRRQHLTEAGQLYYERSKRVLDDIAEAESSLDALRATPRGTLRITSSVAVGARFVAPVLGEFLRQYADIRVELHLSDHVVDLVETGFDAGIRTGIVRDGNLVARPLAPYRTMICAAPAYLARHGTPRKPADLAAHEFLNFSFWTSRDRLRLLGKDGEHLVHIDGRLRINNGEALRQAALAGCGVVVQAQSLLDDDVRRGRLVRLLPQYELPSRPAHLVYLPDRRPTPKLQRFIEFILEKMGPQTAQIAMQYSPSKRNKSARSKLRTR